MKHMTLLIASLLAAQTMLGAASAQDITVSDAYLRVTGAKATSAAAFMQIENHGATDDRLVAVATDAAAMSELHTNIEGANGVVSMVPLSDGIALPAGGHHLLKRGSDHVMLMGLTRPLSDGDTVQFTLQFERTGPVVVEVPVDNLRKPGAAMGHGTMNMGTTGQTGN